MSRITNIILAVVILTLVEIILMKSNANAQDRTLVIERLTGKTVSRVGEKDSVNATLIAGQYKSETKAMYLSLAGTILPVASGIIVSKTQHPRHVVIRDSQGVIISEYDKDPNLTVSNIMILSGITIGPSLGYFYGRCPGRGAAGIGIRLGIGALTALGTSAIIGGHEDPTTISDFVLVLAIVGIGGSMVVGDAIADMVSVKHTVSEANQKRLQSSISLAPGCVGQAKAPGMELTLRF